MWIFPSRSELYPDPAEWINDGESVLVDPMGKIAAGPLRREAGVLHAEIVVARVAPALRTLDVTEHYAGPDIFELQVRREPLTGAFLSLTVER